MEEEDCQGGLGCLTQRDRVPEPGHVSPLLQLLPWAQSTGSWIAPAMEWEQEAADVLKGD